MKTTLQARPTSPAPPSAATFAALVREETGAETAAACLASLCELAFVCLSYDETIDVPFTQHASPSFEGTCCEASLASVRERSEYDPREEDEEGVGAECQRRVLIYGEGQVDGVV